MIQLMTQLFAYTSHNSHLNRTLSGSAASKFYSGSVCAVCMMMSCVMIRLHGDDFTLFKQRPVIMLWISEAHAPHCNDCSAGKLACG